MIELMRELMKKKLTRRLTRCFFRHPRCLKSHLFLWPKGKRGIGYGRGSGLAFLFTMKELKRTKEAKLLLKFDDFSESVRGTSPLRRNRKKLPVRLCSYLRYVSINLKTSGPQISVPRTQKLWPSRGPVPKEG